jgi:hypothetical protein
MRARQPAREQAQYVQGEQALSIAVLYCHPSDENASRRVTFGTFCVNLGSQNTVAAANVWKRMLRMVPLAARAQDPQFEDRRRAIS